MSLAGRRYTKPLEKTRLLDDKRRRCSFFKFRKISSTLAENDARSASASKPRHTHLAAPSPRQAYVKRIPDPAHHHIRSRRGVLDSLCAWHDRDTYTSPRHHASDHPGGAGCELLVHGRARAAGAPLDRSIHRLGSGPLPHRRCGPRRSRQGRGYPRGAHVMRPAVSPVKRHATAYHPSLNRSTYLALPPPPLRAPKRLQQSFAELAVVWLRISDSSSRGEHDDVDANTPTGSAYAAMEGLLAILRAWQTRPPPLRARTGDAPLRGAGRVVHL